MGMRHLVVLDGDHRVVGMITRKDILEKTLRRHWQKEVSVNVVIVGVISILFECLDWRRGRNLSKILMLRRYPLVLFTTLRSLQFPGPIPLPPVSSMKNKRGTMKVLKRFSMKKEYFEKPEIVTKELSRIIEKYQTRTTTSTLNLNLLPSRALSSGII